MLLKAYLAAVFGGALSITSPCTFPILIPFTAFIAVSAVSDRLHKRRRPAISALFRMILLMIGVSLVFIMYAVPNSSGGIFIHNYNNILVIAAGLLLLINGVYFFRYSSDRGKKFIGRPPSLIMAVFIGGALGLAALPCCLGRILAAILMARKVSQTTLLLGYMIGLSVMFILAGGLMLAFILRAAKKEKHQRIVVLTASIILIIMGVLLISGWWSSYIFKLSRFAVTHKTLPVRLEEFLLQKFKII